MLFIIEKGAPIKIKRTCQEKRRKIAGTISTVIQVLQADIAGRYEFTGNYLIMWRTRSFSTFFFQQKQDWFFLKERYAGTSTKGSIVLRNHAAYGKG